MFEKLRTTFKAHKEIKRLKQENARLELEATKRAADIGTPDLMRRLLGAVEVSDIDLEEINERLYKLNPDDMQSQAHQIYNLPLFQMAVKKIVAEQKNHASLMANDWDKVQMARGSINGVFLLQELLEGLNSSYLQRQQEQQLKNKKKS